MDSLRDNRVVGRLRSTSWRESIAWLTSQPLDVMAARLIALCLLLLLAVGFVVALWPEPAAHILTPKDGWTRSETLGVVPLQDYPVADQWVRNSLLKSGQSQSFRTWTPDHGVQPGTVTSPAFPAMPLLSVVITGRTAAEGGGAVAFLECSTQPHRLPIAFGNVNTHVSEALVRVPRNWCHGTMRARLISSSAENVGIGTVSSLASISAWKQSFVGLLPYFASCFVVFGLVGLGGAALLRRVWAIDAVPAAMISIGVAFYGAFWICSFLPLIFEQALLPATLGISVLAFALSPGQQRRALLDELRPAATIWFLVALAVFSLLSLATSGSGNWEPNQRFYPAVWSSDNELPWLFAEGIRNHWNLVGLFGSWSPSDRPPLMAGGHLLVAGAFHQLQHNNDGLYLRGIAYNASAVVQSALWAPALLYVLTKATRLSQRAAARGVILASMMPFFVFNTSYGWPKLLGGAFGLLAVGYVAVANGRKEQSVLQEAILFGVCGALSMLSHASNAFFLAPLGAWFVVRRLYRSPVALMAAGVSGILLLAPWQLYQRFVLPPTNALIKYALTGDPGFTGPSRSVLSAVRDFYGHLTVSGWVVAKIRLAVSAFMPLSVGKGDISPPAWFDEGRFEHLRSWDFYYPSVGSLLFILCAVILLMFAAPRRNEAANFTLRQARELGVIVLIGFLFTVLTCFISPVLIVLSYALVLAFVAAGVAAISPHPRVMAVLFWTSAAYLLIVWGVSPLKNALHIDLVAGVALCMTVVLIKTHLAQRQEASPNGRDRTGIAQGGDSTFYSAEAGRRGGSREEPSSLAEQEGRRNVPRKFKV